MDTREFFHALYPEMPAGARLLVWVLPGERSVWCDSVTAATKAALRERGAHDVYFQVALSPQDFGPARRCVAGETLGIPGLWADFDLRGPHHKKSQLPESIAEIEGLLEDVGLRPTLIVHSGHGLQCYWLFKEFWVFESEGEREKAAVLSRRWLRTLQSYAARRGWEIDATHDLARVLRVPGTFNRKGAA